jgi:ribosomal protein S27E
MSFRTHFIHVKCFDIDNAQTQEFSRDMNVIARAYKN